MDFRQVKQVLFLAKESYSYFCVDTYRDEFLSTY